MIKQTRLAATLLLTSVAASAALAQQTSRFTAPEQSAIMLRGELEQRQRPGEDMNPIRALLLKPIERVSFDEAPFTDFLDWLRGNSTTRGKVNVTVRWRALEIESINQDSPVTIEMEDTTVAEVVNEVLDQLSDIDPLTYIGQNNTLKISTKSDFDKKLYVRVYDIQDIFFKVHNFRGAPEIDLQDQQQSGGGGRGGGGGSGQVQSIFGQGRGGGGNDDDREDDEEDTEREQEILDKIKKIVEPDSWDDSGGLGTAEIINRQLIVLNTLSVHEKLGGPFRWNE